MLCEVFIDLLKGIFALCLANHMSNFTNQFLLQMAWKLRQSASFLITCMMSFGGMAEMGNKGSILSSNRHFNHW